ncbi:hypothetical protein AzCIB_3681 [Azoarcus sp. CIB]|uniref:prenyltransferase/squalene oxidase repeat-containing protein n=1 Tax=Aromatoleum sp. (strain CIB) TaxID=198107 RepID=UPI00067A7E4B|nr:prenyltransferase/squalene oxidase repeat-containing protein [Azoarcus sp. CIB]AKU13574.1 hypothetical protein AzCIB_3681 [Azoarcus sp. CIB]
MNSLAVLRLPLRYKPWSPRHARLILNDLGGAARQPEREHRMHLQAAIDWLCRAQDVRMRESDAGGVSAGWSFEDGWLPGYPETTGYIIETFIAAAEVLERPELLERARRMIDWEMSLQHEDGAFPGHFGEPGSQPVIFNTGQIMHGMIAGAVSLQRTECLDAAVHAGWWLIRQQDSDGCFRRSEHNGVPHVYNTRAIWALVATGLLSGEKGLVDGARRNLDWALTQQTECGWFRTNAFTAGQDPFTHTIAYAIRGFVECGALLDDERYLQAAERAARGMMGVLRDNGGLAGRYGDGWVTTCSYACVTGVAQMALNWLRLGQITGSCDFTAAARRAIGYVKRTQRLADEDDIVRGAIPGSAPIWGDYSRFEFPNWAAKFFADALIMDETGRALPPLVARRECGVPA